VEALVLDNEAAWCDMTLVELWNGVRGAKEKRELAELEGEINLLPVDAGVWRLARKIALLCREEGLTVPSSDIVIAACAANYKVDLEHCDRHFDKILPIAEKV
jgi:predicted nucleic acid-binding protein